MPNLCCNLPHELLLAAADTESALFLPVRTFYPVSASPDPTGFSGPGSRAGSCITSHSSGCSAGGWCLPRGAAVTLSAWSVSVPASCLAAASTISAGIDLSGINLLLVLTVGTPPLLLKWAPLRRGLGALLPSGCDVVFLAAAAADSGGGVSQE